MIGPHARALTAGLSEHFARRDFLRVVLVGDDMGLRLPSPEVEDAVAIRVFRRLPLPAAFRLQELTLEPLSLRFRQLVHGVRDLRRGLSKLPHE